MHTPQPVSIIILILVFLIKEKLYYYSDFSFSNKRKKKFYKILANEWLQSSVRVSIPQNAVIGGNDTDGSIIYVGRALHNGDTLVAKIIPAKQAAFVSWRGEEISKEYFEVLCGSNFSWRHCYDHVIPPNAVECGKTSLGQSIYIGRGHCEGSLTVGKISSVHRALFIPFNGAERRLESYEILVEEENKAGWIVETTQPLPLPPPPPPTSPIPSPLSMMSATAPSAQQIDTLLEIKPEICASTLETSKALVPLPPLELVPSTATPFEPSTPPYVTLKSFPTICIPPKPITMVPVLPTPARSTPAATTTTALPPPIFPTPALITQIPIPPPLSTPALTTEISMPPQPPLSTPALTTQTFIPPPPPPPVEPLYPTPSTNDIWINSNASQIPSDAVHGGHDTDLTIIYVCRAFYIDSLVPGKLIPRNSCAYISYKAQEIPMSKCEVLTGNRKYYWVPANNGNIPFGAVEAGRTNAGELLYVGRAYYGGSLTPGYVQRSHNCMYITYGGVVHRITHYEVLVRKYDYHREHNMRLNY